LPEITSKKSPDLNKNVYTVYCVWQPSLSLG